MKKIAAYINSTNDADTFDIYCNETDICKIDCQSTDACSLLLLHCGSTPSRCYVKCDQDNGINCPNGASFYEWTPESPTAVPTIPPTADTTTISQTTQLNLSTEFESSSAASSTFGTTNRNKNDTQPTSGISIPNEIIVILVIIIGILLLCCMIGWFLFCDIWKKQKIQVIIQMK